MALKKKKISVPKKSEKVAVKKATAPTIKSPSLKLKEILDISYAEKLKAEVMQSFEKFAEKGLTLDASSVNRVTTPCVQVILAVAQSCSMASVNFKIISPSEAFARAFDDLGLTNQLNNWSN